MTKEVSFTAKIENIQLDVRMEEGNSRRYIKIKFGREFDESIADLFGGDGRTHLASLRAHGCHKVWIDADRILAETDLISAEGETVTVKAMRGLMATCTAPRDENDGPAVKFEVECFYDRGVWGFLGDNSGGIVGVKMRQRQQELGLEGSKG